MENLRVAADATFREEVTSHVDGIDLKAAFEQRYGRRGWQRKLGTVLDVPETTVNGWFKSNKFPALATLAFGVLLSRTIRPSRRWIPVKNGAGYAVCDTVQATPPASSEPGSPDRARRNTDSPKPRSSRSTK